MEFAPRRTPGLLVGAGISLGLLVLTGIFLRRLLQTPISLASFGIGVVGVLTVVGALVFIYWTFGCWWLKYEFAEGSLILRWGAVKHIVPLSLVERAFRGEEVASVPKIRGINWFGYHVGSAKVESVGPVVFYSTHRSRRDLVFVVTPGLSYGLSPANPRGFLRKLTELKEQVSGPQASPKALRWRPFRLPFWKDRYAQLIVLAGLLINAALFAYVTYFFPTLPELLPMHFTVLGEVDLIGLRSEVLKLPAMAFVVFASNAIFGIAVHDREKVAAYLCLTAAVFVQIVFWVATVRIVY